MKISKKTHIRIPLIYALIGIVWIPVTDMALKVIDLSLEQLLLFEIVKGLFFVIATAGILYVLLKKQVELKQADEERQKLQTLINTMPDFVVFKDGNGKWIQANRVVLEFFGLDGSEYPGKTDTQLAAESTFYTDTFISCMDSDKQAWKSKSLFRIEEEVILKDGSVKTFDVYKVPLFSKEGSRKGLLVIGRDVSELKETEHLLRQSEKLSVIGELAAGVAHEIRNPLTSVKGFIQFINENSNAKQEHINLVLSELERINYIVSELLVVAKPQKSDYTEVNVNRAIQDVLSFISMELSLKNIELRVSIGVEDALIYGCERQLKQVFINILKNSIDSIEGRGIIQLRISSDKGSILIRVEDNGCGIEEERLKKIGEPFYSSKEKGIGLGMTVTYRIIESHKGRISISSKVDAGTVVELSLPKVN